MPLDGLAVPMDKKGPTMKLIVLVALAAAVFLALVMGKDDIRRIRRMRAM